ncbi:hypothetical protein PG990_003648 [Apiospora arundinis]
MVKPHHCPRKGKKGAGPCASSQKSYCTNHQGPCPKHPNDICLKGQRCRMCIAEDTSNNSRARAAKLKAEKEAEMAKKLEPASNGKIKGGKT